MNSVNVIDKEEFPNPIKEFDLAVSPCDWENEEYPSIDDIKAWMHLYEISLQKQDYESKPVIPDLIIAFKRTVSDLIYCRDFLQARGFFETFGTLDFWIACERHWLSILKLNIQECGLQELTNHFPPNIKPIRLSSHTDPSIKILIDHLKPKDAIPIVFVDSKTFIEPRSEFFQSSDKQDSVASVLHFSDSLSKQKNEKENSDLTAVGIHDQKQEHEKASDLYSSWMDFESIKPGESLGSGRNKGRIGAGGTAVVYAIENDILEVLRAVKVFLLNKICENGEQISSMKGRVELEAKITGQMSHANIVQLFAYGEFHGMPYLEMEYIKGMDFKALISNRGSLPFEFITASCILAVRALVYAHSQEYSIYGKRYSSIIHRDLKPSNILVSEKGTIKVVDWGMAKPTDVSLNTKANNIVGTLAYMAPEQFETSNVDTRADIYAIGVTMYEMITGRQMFPNKNLMELIEVRKQNFYRPISDYRRNVPKDLVTLIDRCVRLNLDERIRSANVLLDSLESVHRKLTKESPENVIYDFIIGKRMLSTATNNSEIGKFGFMNRFLNKNSNE